ncbi:hypothetical protein M9H77_07394 [Catharanthus roseus]|uniref:Uncharacterized protein n=1 Tax=Catharanthus roseus TaxID=4058 RepID=A0ACC0BUT3_CATRO|nr:hypothetical protein M9H77_07394 [Catharanthus roseus]
MDHHAEEVLVAEEEVVLRRRRVIHIKREATEKFKTRMGSEHTWPDGPIIMKFLKALKKILLLSNQSILWLRRNPFSWNNKRADDDNIQERLDRGMTNDLWRVLFPQAVVSHLTTISSYHKPLLLHSSPPSNSHPKPFRFEAMRTMDDSIGSVIDSSWRGDVSGTPLFKLTSKLKNLKAVLKSWNKSVFDEMEARAIVECLGTFAAWSRQLINFDKSVVHFSKIWRITLRLSTYYGKSVKQTTRIESESTFTSGDSICAPKLYGGLGFLLFRDVNKAFIAKLGCQLCRNDDKQWIKLIKSRYLRGRKIWDLESCESGCSWVWRSIWDSREVLLKGLCLQAGGQSGFRIMKDPWIPSLTGAYDASKDLTLKQWIQEMMDPNNCVPLSKEETEELLNFGVIAVEVVWKSYIRQG